MTISKAKLEIAMANACMNSIELCEKAKIGKHTLVQIKSGKRNPKPVTIGKIARALDIKVIELIEE